ncbi:hypothetical protein HID58_095172, partial [Brassica napus]
EDSGAGEDFQTCSRELYSQKLKVNELRAKLAERGLVPRTQTRSGERLERAIAQDAKRRKRTETLRIVLMTRTSLIAIGEVVSCDECEGVAEGSVLKRVPRRKFSGGSAMMKLKMTRRSPRREINKEGSSGIGSMDPDHVKSEYHGDDVYDAMLNQTNVRDNNNKFFVLQSLITRKTYWSTSDGEELVFYDKTRNHWSDRKEFFLHPKSYAWLEVDYGKKKNDSVVNDIPKSSSKVTRDESKLDPQVAKFISLICSDTTLKNYHLEAKQVHNIKVLQRISEMIERYDRARLEELMWRVLYCDTPCLVSRKCVNLYRHSPKVKQNRNGLKHRCEIEFATKLMILYIITTSNLNCELTPVGADSEVSMVAKYMENTHAKADSGYTVEMIQLFRARELLKLIDSTIFEFEEQDATWHGSRSERGLLCRYVLQSVNYCYANSGSNDGVLLLCEVALGDVNELYIRIMRRIICPREARNRCGENSTKRSEAKTLEEGVVVPLGKPEDSFKHHGDVIVQRIYCLQHGTNQDALCDPSQFNYK